MSEIASKQRRILIVEDSATQAEILKYMLQKQNYVVDVATNGKEALEYVKINKPMTVVSDILMPEMDGYELCRRIKKDNSLKDIPVILLTSLSDPEDVIMGLECQADFFIMKSFDDRGLLSRIKYIEEMKDGNIEEINPVEMEIFFQKKKHIIRSAPVKILNFLLATYETAVHKNKELLRTQENIKLEIEERKRLEVELKRAKEKAESANKAKSIFLSSMSHEIRTPMNAILGFSQLMLLDDNITEQQKQRLLTINKSGEHLLGLIDDILDISKIEAGRINVNMTTFDIKSLVKDIEEMFRLKAESKNLQMIIEFIGNIPHYVVTDEGKLRQILINLISNAIKFTKEGGIAVRLKADPGEKGYYTLSVEVEDSGPGLSDKDMASLFQVFQQTSTGIKEGGTGLGLALSKQFAKLLGGDVVVRSELGKGSCFFLTIEMMEGNQKQIQNKRVHKKVIGLKGCSSDYKILVVDDRHENREFMNAIIKPLGIQTQEAASGEEAIEIYKQWNPDLVFMDLRMSKMDGLEATRQIRTLSMGQKPVKIIIVTATAFDNELQKLKDSGAETFIRKPFKINEIYEAMQEYLHVEFLYSEKEEEDELVIDGLKEEIKNRVSSKEREQITEAIVNAQLDRILEQIDIAHGLSYEATQQLKMMANGFQYEALMELFSEGGH